MFGQIGLFSVSGWQGCEQAPAQPAEVEVIGETPQVLVEGTYTFELADTYVALLDAYASEMWCDVPQYDTVHVSVSSSAFQPTLYVTPHDNLSDIRSYVAQWNDQSQAYEVQWAHYAEESRRFALVVTGTQEAVGQPYQLSLKPAPNGQ